MSRSDCVVFVSFLMISCASHHLSAQVWEVGGGTSSLYQASGGSATMHGPSYDFTLGAGIVDGHILEGSRLIKATPHGTYIAGDERLPFRLPTDIFDSSHYLLARGLGFSGIRHDIDITAFVGAMSLDYSSPFFNGAKTSDPAAILFLKKHLSSKWQLFSDTVASKKVTEIAALQWLPARKTEVSFAAGVGANQPYAAASLNFSRPLIDIQAAYILAGQQFHRIDVSSPLLAEPNHENISITLRPLSFLTLTGTHQNYLVPLYPSTTNVKSSIDQGGASLHLLGAQFSGTIYHSSYDAASNHAVAIFANRDFGPRFHLISSYLASRPKGSRPTDTFLSTLSEKLTSRLSVNENVTYSNGQTNVNFGGELLSNFITIGASYETYYVPANNSQPFEQALLIDVKMRLFGRLLLHGASFVDPTGHLRYTVDANTVLSHQRLPPAAVEHAVVGRYILRGCVQDTTGAAIEGAAVTVDEKPVYTDSTGCFTVRESKQRTHKLGVVLSEFLAGGNWQIISMPTTVTSTLEENGAQMTVLVIVRKVRIVSGNADHPVQQGQGAELK